MTPLSTSDQTETVSQPVRLPRLASRRVGVAGILGAIALSGLVVIGVRSPLRQPPTEPSPPLRVTAMTLEAANAYSVSRVYTGEVAAGRTSELGFEQSGELVEIAVDRGDRVDAGQLLARLDSRRLEAQRRQLVAQRDGAAARLAELRNGPRREDIATAAATVQDLEQQLELERLRQQRRQVLYSEGAISQEDRDVVAFNAEALAERLTAARSQLAELQAGTRPEQIAAQQAEVEQLEARLIDIDLAIEKTAIFAPFAGAIAMRQVDEGTVVSAGQVVLKLVEQAAPEVEVGLPAEVVAGLRLGQGQSFEIGGQQQTGTLVAILPDIDPLTRTQTVVFRLRDVGASLLPEQLATVAIAQTVATEGFWLPLTALTQGERGLWAAYALVPAEPEGFRVQQRDVELLHTAGERAFVRGLVEAGDRIVTDGLQRLVPGQIVQIEP